jgi:hypothetical protein
LLLTTRALERAGTDGYDSRWRLGGGVSHIGCVDIEVPDRADRSSPLACPIFGKRVNGMRGKKEIGVCGQWLHAPTGYQTEREDSSKRSPFWAREAHGGLRHNAAKLQPGEFLLVVHLGKVRHVDPRVDRSLMLEVDRRRAEGLRCP